MKQPVIGILGGIAAGKSFVSAELSKYGGYIINADRIGHEALLSNNIKEQVIRRWGRDILDDHKEIDRAKLAKIVFSNEKQKKDLEEVVFPYIEFRCSEEIEKARKSEDVKFIVLDASILMEAGWTSLCRWLLFVDCARETRTKRVVEGRRWTEKDLLDREKMQLPLSVKSLHADVVVNNSGPAANVPKQIFEVLKKWNLIEQQKNG